MNSKKTAVLSMEMLRRLGAFENMTPGHALVYRFCTDVDSGADPSKDDMQAIAYALRPILSLSDDTDNLMAEVARRLKLTRKQGQERTARMELMKSAELVARYLLMVEKLVESGKPLKVSQKEARAFYAKMLGIGDRAMRDRIRKHENFALAMLPVLRE